MKILFNVLILASNDKLLLHFQSQHDAQGMPVTRAHMRCSCSKRWRRNDCIRKLIHLTYCKIIRSISFAQVCRKCPRSVSFWTIRTICRLMFSVAPATKYRLHTPAWQGRRGALEVRRPVAGLPEKSQQFGHASGCNDITFLQMIPKIMVYILHIIFIRLPTAG